MEKTCNKCSQTKLLEDFPKKKDMKDGRHGSCKVCEGKRKAKYKYTVEEWKDWRLKKNYGITLEDYNIMLESQEYCCAICNTHIDDYQTQVKGNSKYTAQRSKQNFSVDHCHHTNKVRGLLCYNCNLMLGNSKDSPDVLIKAANYLKEKARRSELLG